MKKVFSALVISSSLFSKYASAASGKKIDCKKTISQNTADDSPFKITIDDELMQNQGCNDLKLEKSDIQVRYDSLELDPKLNITAYPDAAVRGSKVFFTPYSNYLAFIKKAEVRIFASNKSSQTEPLKIIQIDPDFDKSSSFEIPKDLNADEVKYVLRVYDKKGNFDETESKFLKLTDKKRLVGDEQTKKREENIGYGENHLAIRNIKLYGGTITTNGLSDPARKKVLVEGREIPVDPSGKFADKQIVPAGDYVVDINVQNQDGSSDKLSRAINIPQTDLFYIALADFTAGKNNVKGPASLVANDDSRRYRGKSYLDGRLAFYAKGKVQDEWMLTSSADTQEQPFEDLFSNFASKDPRYLLKRLDQNSYYPVYGDDSTAIEDAPTKGKFYVKLEKGENSVMWGNFQTKLTGSELINYSRSLYGAKAEFKSENQTKYGENKTTFNGFAADPGSISSNEEFRGTGGSLYYLRSQDLVKGSERLRVEVRDRDSGIVLETKYLNYGDDYEINYIQGRVVLRSPLSGTSNASTLVNNGSNNGNPTYLIADYEYTPSVAKIQNLTKGGHVDSWINDHVKLGATSYDQGGTGITQKMQGLDLTLRYKPQTYLKIEGAKSNGSGNGSVSSTDGGFNFNNVAQTRSGTISADAYRLEGAFDLGEVSNGKQAGKLNTYFSKRQEGYSAPGQLTNEDIIQTGSQLSFPVNKKLSFDLKSDYKKGKKTGLISTGEAIGNYAITNAVTLSLGLKNDNRDIKTGAGGKSSILSETGRRIDVATKLNYAPLNENGGKKNYEIYGLAQGTVQRDDTRSANNRGGFGGKYDINQKVTLKGEGTAGSGGYGTKAGIEYRPTDRTSYYSNYEMDTQRSDIGLRGRNSSMTTGGKTRYSDALSMYAEQKQQKFSGGSAGLMHAMGLDLAANERWTYGVKFETGIISDVATGDTNRNTVSLNTNYHFEKTKYTGIIEWRDESGGINGRLDSYLLKNNLAYQTTPDWRFLGEANFAISNSLLGSNLEANYTELSSGYAYRPVNNDSLNALIKYTYLSDLPTQGQLSATGSAADEYEQRSHVFSGDAIFDVTPKLAIGGKLGYRFGQIRSTSSTTNEWFSSSAYLAIFRTDLHIVKKWDLTGEARYLNAKEAQDSKSGFLVGIYRHVGDNAKFGIGYNFTDFSDDLTNLDYKSQGFFINVIGKF